MDEFPARHAYRCLPLTIANAHGWDILCPFGVSLEWNGGPRAEDLIVRSLEPNQYVANFCRSHFTSGVVTFHTDYIFQTDAEWDLLATGPFNSPKHGISPLTGIMESDWLPYPFTMNWRMTAPGSVAFEKGEPFCFIFPVRKQAISDCHPELRDLSGNRELQTRYAAFTASRNDFMRRFHAGDADTLKAAWRKHYFMGRHPDGTPVDGHVNKLRARKPLDCRDK